MVFKSLSYRTIVVEYKKLKETSANRHLPTPTKLLKTFKS